MSSSILLGVFHLELKSFRVASLQYCGMNGIAESLPSNTFQLSAGKYHHNTKPYSLLVLGKAKNGIQLNFRSRIMVRKEKKQRNARSGGE